MSNRKEGATYTMGRTQAETDRLVRQSKLYSGMTRRMLSEAGLAGGMRVLDIGSGAGDVAMAAAELVGPEGQVVGVDVNPGILETARARVEGAGHNNVEFVAGDARTLDLGNDFDALIGRFVLMYLADPAEALKHLATRVRPGGIVAFHEISFSPNRLPHVLDTPLADVLVDWTVGVFNQSGAHADLAYRLYRTYIDAGLPEPHLEYTALAGGWPGWPGYQYVADSVQSVLPLLEHFGIATAEEADVATLPERLRADVVATKSPIALPMTVMAWTRLPAAAPSPASAQ